MYESKCKSKSLLGHSVPGWPAALVGGASFSLGTSSELETKMPGNNLVSLGMKKIFQLDAPIVQMETKKSHSQGETFGGSWTHGLTGWAVIKSS